MEIQRLEAEIKRKVDVQEAATRKRRLEQETEEVQQRIQRVEEEAKIKAQLEEEQLKTLNWFTGTKFLWQKQLPDRECKMGEIQKDDHELSKALVCNTQAKEQRSLLDRLKKFSDWSRVLGAFARLKRKVKEYKGVTQRANESTSLEERKEAELAIIKLVQEDTFSDEIKSFHCGSL